MRYSNRARTTAASGVTTNATLLPLHNQPVSFQYDDSTVIRQIFSKLEQIQRSQEEFFLRVEELLTKDHKLRCWSFWIDISVSALGSFSSLAQLFAKTKE